MATPNPKAKLGPGATGDMVRAMQHALIANGYSVGSAGANGHFDADTTAALEAFQDNKNLIATTRPGPRSIWVEEAHPRI
jgi:peptidoglycan hydrolase-like protein with peptidoglycan-binding domain